jgi:hypothetical protein
VDLLVLLHTAVSCTYHLPVSLWEPTEQELYPGHLVTPSVQDSPRYIPGSQKMLGQISQPGYTHPYLGVITGSKMDTKNRRWKQSKRRDKGQAGFQSVHTGQRPRDRSRRARLPHQGPVTHSLMSLRSFPDSLPNRSKSQKDNRRKIPLYVALQARGASQATV